MCPMNFNKAIYECSDNEKSNKKDSKMVNNSDE